LRKPVSPADREQPQQVIDPQIKIPIRIVDCSDLPDVEREKQTRELVGRRSIILSISQTGRSRA
jgi:hypothetical protein